MKNKRVLVCKVKCRIYGNDGRAIDLKPGDVIEKPDKRMLIFAQEKGADIVELRSVTIKKTDKEGELCQ